MRMSRPGVRQQESMKVVEGFRLSYKSSSRCPCTVFNPRLPHLRDSFQISYNAFFSSHVLLYLFDHHCSNFFLQNFIHFYMSKYVLYILHIALYILLHSLSCVPIGSTFTDSNNLRSKILKKKALCVP